MLVRRSDDSLSIYLNLGTWKTIIPSLVSLKSLKFGDNEAKDVVNTKPEKPPAGSGAEPVADVAIDASGKVMKSTSQSASSGSVLNFFHEAELGNESSASPKRDVAGQVSPERRKVRHCIAHVDVNAWQERKTPRRQKIVKDPSPRKHHRHHRTKSHDELDSAKSRRQLAMHHGRTHAGHRGRKRQTKQTSDLLGDLQVDLNDAKALNGPESNGVEDLKLMLSSASLDITESKGARSKSARTKHRTRRKNEKASSSSGIEELTALAKAASVTTEEIDSLSKLAADLSMDSFSEDASPKQPAEKESQGHSEDLSDISSLAANLDGIDATTLLEKSTSTASNENLGDADWLSMFGSQGSFSASTDETACKAAQHKDFDATASLLHSVHIAEDMNKAGLQRAKKQPLSWKGNKNAQLQQEDAWYVGYPFNEDENRAVFCIFDGHAGSGASKAATKIVPNEFQKQLSKKKKKIRDLSEVFHVTFLRSDDQMAEYEYEGCTGTLVCLWRAGNHRYLQSANVGDSSAYLW